MPFSLIDKMDKPKPALKVSRTKNDRKKSLDDLIVPQPKKCVEALTPDEVMRKKSDEKTSEETGTSIRETIRQQRLKGVALNKKINDKAKKRKLSRVSGTTAEEIKIPKIEHSVEPILPSSPKAKRSHSFFKLFFEQQK